MTRTWIDLFPTSTHVGSDGCLSIAGHSLSALAAEWGTPLYVFDAATVRGQVESMRGLMQKHYPGKFDITYAAKAYFSMNMARHLALLGLGVDVVSMGELNVAQAADFAPQRVHLHGNNKSEAELRAAVEWGVQAVVVDSLEELAFLESLCAKMKRSVHVWLRVTPGIHVDTHAYRQTAHPASKFGLPISDGQAAEGIRRAQASPWLRLTGLHTHLGSQFFDAEPYRQAVDLLCDLAESADYVPEEISPGGGWGVPYTLDDPDRGLEEWIGTVCQSVQENFARRGWPLPKLVLEPGRQVVARAGVVIYTVGTTKTAGDGTYFVAVDGGMADNPRPALYQARYSVARVDMPNSPVLRKCTIVGKFCESGDHLISDVMLPPVDRGDRVAMPVAGAYHLSMSSNYNLATRPAVLWLEEGKVEVLQHREEPQKDGWWVS